MAWSKTQSHQAHKVLIVSARTILSLLSNNHPSENQAVDPSMTAIFPAHMIPSQAEMMESSEEGDLQTLYSPPSKTDLE
jgi:hypothetical protein